MKTLLIIDDEFLFLKVAIRFFERRGYHVFSATTGSEAVEISRLHHAKLDGVLLDQELPDCCGTECLVQMRQYGVQAPVIMMSGYPMESFDAATKSQINGILTKPFELTDAEDYLIKILSDASYSTSAT
ncbi:MAG: response regulator [Spartobacteria bacterium]|nr:response regulator [Spartobacteria bacterium]